jgi:AraC-like DNA-binding protein
VGETTPPVGSYAECAPQAVRQSSAGLRWDVTCNYDELPAFRQPRRVFDEHHWIINIGRTAGRVRHEVVGPDGRDDFRGVVRPNEVVFVPAGCEVSWTLHDPATALSIRLPRDFLQGVLDEHGLGPLRPRPRVPARLPGVVRIGRQLLDTLRRADGEANRARCRVRARGLALELAAELIDLSRPATRRTPAAAREPGLERVREFVESGVLRGELAAPPDLEDSARRVGLSRYHFSRLFKQLTGVSHDDYVRRLRIEQAKVWLREGKSIRDTARDLGFDAVNLRHFYAVFKAHAGGRTPGGFRDAAS